MESFYDPQLSAELQQRLQQQQARQNQQHQQHQHQQGQTMQQRQMSMMGNPNPESLDDIISNNHNELGRRRSIHIPYNQQMMQNEADRRMSMMDYGNAQDQYRAYTFGDANQNNGYGMGNMNGGMQQNMMSNGMQQNNMGNVMMPNQMNGNGMSGAMDTFSNQEVLHGLPSNDYVQYNSDMINMIPNNFASMNMSTMDSNGNNGMNMGNMNGGGNDMNMFATSPLATQFPVDPINNGSTDVAMDLGLADNSSMNPPDTMMQRQPSMQMGVSNGEQVPQNQTMTLKPPPVMQQAMQQAVQNAAQPAAAATAELTREVSSTSISPPRGSSLSTPQTTGSQNAPSSATTPAIGPQTPRPEAKEKTVYSKSGFDMLRALWYVATRKNAEIHLGAVDMSCAFVVCDVSLNDCPIIYVSDNFQNLTGYSRHEIVGQNCRFLQSPDGKVEAGSKREFVDDGAVYNLKKNIHEGKEVQQSLINYRKGGKPFLNLLTMIPIPWDDPNEIRFFVGFQIDLVECPDAISSGQELGGVQINYKHSDIGQYIWTPPTSSQWEPENGQTLGVDDVSTLLQQFNPKGVVSDWHKQSWDKMLLENTDDVVHVLSLKGLFMYVSPSCKKVLEYDAAELAGNSLSTVCHPSDIVPVTRELKDTTPGSPVNIVFRIRRKHSGYTWFESHGSLFVEQGKGRKSIILVGRKRPVYTLSRRQLDAHGGIGDSEVWTKLSTSGMFLFVASNVRSLLDLHPNELVGTSIQELMRKETRAEFGRAIEKARRGKIVTCKHEVQNRRGQVLQAQTILYPGDAVEGEKPTFLLGQTKLLKASSRAIAPAATPTGSIKSGRSGPQMPNGGGGDSLGTVSVPGGASLKHGSQDAALAADDNIFDELRTTKCSSWQFELRQMEKVNRILAEELGGLLSNKKKRKRRKGVGNVVRDCANCHTRNTPEWRRGPSGQRDLCNSCGLRWAKQTGRVSPRNSSRGASTVNELASKRSNSPVQSSPLHREIGSTEGAAPATGGEAAGNATPGMQLDKVHATMPPPSQPLLEGGSGAAVTSICEEREGVNA
ncbi:GATA zinc finger protein [Plectosphaerella plurivora]|uniref:GATA zinc finger protein n=1 Tax=Plectosphaerella plurivora TaxID=936078 RepID=A0A9P8V2F3_9PEZI|nr:GATA zinc finger protein [Plectosphaerella plurivora]